MSKTHNIQIQITIFENENELGLNFKTQQHKSYSKYRHDFSLKNFKKANILVVKYDSKINTNHLQELKKPRKTILSVLNTILDENVILKKKVTKFTQKYKNFCDF